jgi:hypothetical protein
LGEDTLIKIIACLFIAVFLTSTAFLIINGKKQKIDKIETDASIPVKTIELSAPRFYLDFVQTNSDGSKELLEVTEEEFKKYIEDIEGHSVEVSSFSDNKYLYYYDYTHSTDFQMPVSKIEHYLEKKIGNDVTIRVATPEDVRNLKEGYFQL